LHEASEEGHLGVVEYLIYKGAKLEESSIKKIISKKGCTLLHLASQNDHLDVVKYLISNGANVNEKDKDKKTPLHYAIEKDHFDVIEYFVSDVLNVNQNYIDNIDEIYADKNAKVLFEKYLVKRMNMENLLFIEKVTQYDELCNSGKLDLVKDEHENILNDFIKFDGKFSINIPKKTADMLLTSTEGPKYGFFNDAIKEFRKIIRTNIIPDFKRSQEGIKYIGECFIRDLK
jgi:ankyrin repeat protein